MIKIKGKVFPYSRGDTKRLKQTYRAFSLAFDLLTSGALGHVCFHILSHIGLEIIALQTM